MDELVTELLGGEEAWIVGGAIRDELLGRPVLDLDVACREPERAARRYAKRSGGAPFSLSERHGAWRVALETGRTVDFTPLPEGIEADLATRDFALNAIAVPVAGGAPVDPYGGRADIEARAIRAVSDTVFADDPLRLLRAARLEDELDFRLDGHTEELVRAHAERVGEPAGERILAELYRLSPAGYRRLDELGLLVHLGGSLAGPLDALDDPGFRLVAVFRESLRRFPISNDLARYATTLLRAEAPADGGARAIHRFRRATEPWALDALAFLGVPELGPAVEVARLADPAEPLVRGDELGLPPGPEIGRILSRIEEERASGTISTRQEALALVRREARP
ncbi:MAG: CCA tRNA nucleotidyltransferase [Actinobacteria bacterium]|nr:CCA tRNA nucleotidyltransferase [Actinomycetota bacterium]